MSTRTAKKAAPKTTTQARYELPADGYAIRRESEVEAILVECGFTYQNNCKAGSTPYQVYAIPGPEADYKAVLPLLKLQFTELPRIVGKYILGRALKAAAGNYKEELAWHVQTTSPGLEEELYSHRVNEGWKKIQNALKAIQPRRPVVFIMNKPPTTGGSGGPKVDEEEATTMSEDFLEMLAKLKE